MRQRKIEAIRCEALQLYTSEIPDEFFESTNSGERLTMSGVKYLSDKVNFFMRMANIYELQNIDNKKQAIRIGSTVGTKKRIEIEKEAENLDIRILNVGREKK